MSNQFIIRNKVIKSGEYKLESSPFLVESKRDPNEVINAEIDQRQKILEDLKIQLKQIENDIQFKKNRAEKEYEDIILKAEAEAERIIKEAEKSAFQRVKESLEEKEKIIEQRKEEEKVIIDNANKQAAEIINQANIKANEIFEEARKKGFEQGREEGFTSGKEELNVMIQRLRVIITSMIEERERILIHSENQIMNLVLTMVRRIVKKLTDEQKNIVVENIKEALSIIKGTTKVYIHVNPDDYAFTIENKDELIKMIEGIPDVKFLEDPRIERGGVYIETDIGEVDATISTQLSEIEQKLKYYIPVKVKTNLSNETESGS